MRFLDDARERGAPSHSRPGVSVPGRSPAGPSRQTRRQPIKTALEPQSHRRVHTGHFGELPNLLPLPFVIHLIRVGSALAPLGSSGSFTSPIFLIGANPLRVNGGSGVAKPSRSDGPEGRPRRGGRERDNRSRGRRLSAAPACVTSERLGLYVAAVCGPACGVRASLKAKPAADAGPAAPLAVPLLI